MKKILLFLVILFLSDVAVAQNYQRRNQPDNRKEILQLSHMTGVWKGQGWMRQGKGSRFAFSKQQEVTLEAGSTSMLRKSTISMNQQKRQRAMRQFQSLGVLSIDPGKNAFVIYTFASNGNVSSYYNEIAANVYQWKISISEGLIRYTENFSRRNEWQTIGEFSNNNGESWVQFYEMNYTRYNQ